MNRTSIYRRILQAHLMKNKNKQTKTSECDFSVFQCTREGSENMTDLLLKREEKRCQSYLVQEKERGQKITKFRRKRKGSSDLSSS